MVGLVYDLRRKIKRKTNTQKPVLQCAVYLILWLIMQLAKQQLPFIWYELHGLHVLCCLTGHWYQCEETSNKDLPRHLHWTAGLPKDSWDVCENDTEGERRGRHPCKLCWSCCRPTLL